jgi:hypothetical protein
MDAMETAVGLCGFEGRGSGTDAERRAAVWLAQRLRDAGREAELETVWVRPHESAALALHALLAVAGGVLAAFSAVAGVAVLAAVALSLVLDLRGGPWLLRRLTLRRATQNVVSRPPTRPAEKAQPPIRLVITARYDAGRTGLVRRPALQRVAARVPGARALLLLAVLLALAAAAARLAFDANWVGVVQLVPTVALLLAAALLADNAVSARSTAASDASAVGVALALAAALDESPPSRLAVHVVLAGAGGAPAAGLRGFVRTRRRRWPAEDVAVLHLEPCARGRPRWWVKDGPLWPHALHPQLRAVAARVALEETHLEAGPHSGHGVTGAHAASVRGWPALAIGCLDSRGVAAGRDGAGDAPEAIDAEAMQATLELCLALVDELDADLEGLDAGDESPAAAAAR